MKQISEQERDTLLAGGIAAAELISELLTHSLVLHQQAARETSLQGAIDKLTKASELLDEIETRIKLDQQKGKDETEMASITN